MDLFNNLIIGFTVAATPMNLLYCLIGVFIGTLIGVLPGIGPLTTIAMLLPLTYTLPPVSALIMPAGIFYGAQYGGSTTAILVNLPGEASSVVTCIDGHAMAKQGRAGAALAIAAVGSFFAGTVCTLLIAAVGPPIAEYALEFSAPEYFSLMLMGLVCAAVLAQGDLLKSLAMITLGLIIGIVGTDVGSGKLRFIFGRPELIDGIGVPVVAMGVFGLAEIVRNLGDKTSSRDLLSEKIAGLWPTWPDFKQSFWPMVRATAIGSIFGPLPGTGSTLSAFSSYALEKKLAKDPSRFGRGAIEGVAGPETANNASSQTTFIPMLTLGIPGSASMALMLSVMIMNGIAPGPQVMTERPELFWGLIASMWIGNAMLLCLNLPLIHIWVKLLKVPYRLLFPIIMAFMAIGVYSMNNVAFDTYLLALFGFLGYMWGSLKCEVAPMILAIVLGPLIEENLRRALVISHGDPTVFFTRPISAACLIITVIFLLMFVVPMFRKKRAEVLAEEGSK